MRQLGKYAPPDIILKNGKIVTLDAQERVEQAVAISGNRIAAVGSDDQILGLARDDTKIVDLKQCTVIPGINDSHNHVISAGKLLEGVMLFDARNMHDVKQKVAERVMNAERGQWIEGGGWIESQFDEYRAPTRWDLDEVSPHNPVLLRRLFGASVANSEALRLAGINRDTPEPKRGTIVRNADGEPTGVLANGADSIVMGVMPLGSKKHQLDTMKAHIKRATQEYVKWGITSVLDPGVAPLAAQAYQELRDAGELSIRVSMMPVWHGLRTGYGVDVSQKVANSGVYSGFGDEWLRLSALKMAIDGGLGSKTALLNWPFADGTYADIPLRLDVEQLREYFDEAHSAGWSIGIHCCGDKAQDIACRCFAEVIGQNPRPRMRHNIIHAYFATAFSLETMKRYGILASVQPGFIFVEGDIYYDVAEEHRLHGFTPLRTYIDNGILVAANSDMTSAHYNPFLGMYSAVTRKTVRGRVMGEAERISRLEMLRLFTRNGAYLTFEEDRKGEIAPGMLADLAVLSDDILSVPDEDIRELRVLLTMVDGRIVHDYGVTSEAGLRRV